MRATIAFLALALLPIAALTAACRPAASPSAAEPAPSAIRYEASVSGPSPWIADVEATFEGGASTFVTEAPRGVVSMVIDDSSGTRVVKPSLAALGGSGIFRLSCPDTCRVRYRFDMTRAALQSEDPLGAAVARSPDMLALGHIWLLRPAPLSVDVPVDIVVKTSPGVKLASALRPREGGPHGPEEHAFTLLSQELVSAGYMAFGSFTELRAEATGASLNVTVLRGDRAASDDVLQRWVTATARTLDLVFGRFPVPQAQIFVVPTEGSSEVELGRTQAAGGSTVAVVVGAGADEDDLSRDWILTHEFFHLGVPSFRRDGRWLDEGLATYYEPVLRTRAGVRSDLELWTELANGLPRGVAHEGELSLLHTERHERLYWGGAMFALEADVLIRSRSKGTRSLDDGLRAALGEGANATRMWTLPAYLDAIDRGTGLRVMRELYEVAASRGRAETCVDGALKRSELPGWRGGEGHMRAKTASEVEQAAFGFAPSHTCALSEEDVLDGLMRSLGVFRSMSGEVALVDGAPLSAVRRRVSARAAGSAAD